MTRRTKGTIARRLLISIFLIAPSAIAQPALGDDKKVSQGCTTAQLRSSKGSVCIEKGERDLIANRPVHSLLCLGSDLKCCIRDGNRFINCEDLGSIAPPPDIMCADMKAEKGVWTPDPKSIKPNADKKTCSQTYTCNPPSELPPIAKAVNCKAVVSVSHKQVTQNGTCVPGSSPGTCSSCLGNPPNDPCTVTFTK